VRTVASLTGIKTRSVLNQDGERTDVIDDD